jgi:hypothetical protein
VSVINGKDVVVVDDRHEDLSWRYNTVSLISMGGVKGTIQRPAYETPYMTVATTVTFHSHTFHS